MDNTVSFHQDAVAPAYLTAMRAIQPVNVLAAVSTPVPAMLADNISGSTSSDLKFGIKGDTVSATADVKMTFKIKICYDETIFNVTETSFSVKQETKLEGKLSKSFTGKKDTYKEESKPVTIPVATGIDVEIQAYFVFDVDVSADGTFSGTIITENGTKYSGGESYPINESDADLSFDVTDNFNVSTGFGVTASAKVLKVFKIGFSGKAGIELDGKAEIIHASTQKEEKHLCASCTDGTIDAYFEVDFKAKVGVADKYSWTLADLKLAKVKVEFAKFYISFLGGSSPVEFGWGKCPHKQYLVTVVATDQFGNRLDGVLVNVFNNDTNRAPVPDVTTGKDGTYQVYCDNGNYKITGYGLDGYQDASETVDISSKAKTVMLQMEKDTVTSGIMTYDVYGGVYDLYEANYGVVGTATMNILSDKEAVFSIKFTANNVYSETYVYGWFGYYNTYSIEFGGNRGNWDGDNLVNYEAPLFYTGYSTFRPYGHSSDEYTRFDFSEGDFSYMLTPYTIRADIAKALYTLLSDMSTPEASSDKILFHDELLDWPMLKLDGSNYAPAEMLRQIAPMLTIASDNEEESEPLMNQPVHFSIPMKNTDRVFLSSIQVQNGDIFADVPSFRYHGTQYMMLRPVADLFNIDVRWNGESKTIELY